MILNTFSKNFPSLRNAGSSIEGGNLGADYARRVDAICPALGKKAPCGAATVLPRGSNRPARSAPAGPHPLHRAGGRGAGRGEVSEVADALPKGTRAIPNYRVFNRQWSG